ncbi:uncharacterized protein LOC131255242 [Magnolia sinica]|uniref:uncharacterized protein LOC131255242 n=1 Tax=Magnolia sinica TaxID=86752 RepID=UPI00265ADF08|nr:uncharacterized protein LOC131255242 [Magnolia sinica]
MFRDLDRKTKGDNIFIKLDMEKAYDRLYWCFLLHVLRRFGSGDKWITMVEKCWSNSWFSVLLNGEACDFFQSTRGLRQRDPISPGLFILSAEVLSRGFSNLMSSGNCLPCHTCRDCPTVSRILFANDTLLLANGAMKPCVVSSLSWTATIGPRAKNVTPVRVSSSFTPINLKREAATDIPLSILRELDRACADFFWGWEGDRKRYHWVSWNRISYPRLEGGLGVRSLTSVMRAFRSKMAWNIMYRVAGSAWASFMKQKYKADINSSSLSLSPPPSRASPLWKAIRKLFAFVTTHSRLIVVSGCCDFWRDDWTSLSPLQDWMLPQIHSRQNSVQAAQSLQVNQLIDPSGWKDIATAIYLLPSSILDHVTNEGICTSEAINKRIWVKSKSGDCTLADIPFPRPVKGPPALNSSSSRLQDTPLLSPPPPILKIGMIIQAVVQLPIGDQISENGTFDKYPRCHMDICIGLLDSDCML